MTTAVASKPATHSLSAYGPARSTVQGAPLTLDELEKIDAYWRACEYLALGMIYLQANPLLKEPLKPEHIRAEATRMRTESTLRIYRMEMAVRKTMTDCRGYDEQFH